MLRRIGLPLVALAALVVLLAPSPAAAKSHFGFGVFVGPSYPVYPYDYTYPYPYSYPRYYYDPYYYPYAYYSYPAYGYWGGSYYWRGHRDRDEFRGRGWGRGSRGDHDFRSGGRRYGR